MSETKTEKVQETDSNRGSKESIKDPKILRNIKGIASLVRQKTRNTLRAIKNKALKRFPYSVEDVPEGEAGIDWILQHRQEVFPSTKQEIQFDNGGAPSQSKFYSEAAAAHSRYVSEMGYAHSTKTKEKVTEARREAATLINCEPEEIAFEENTVEGIRNIVEKFDWEEGDQVVVLRKDMEYPTNYSPWAGLEKFGVSIVEVGDENGFVSPEEIKRALDSNPKIRLVALSSVGWKTGQRVDLEGVGKAIADSSSEGNKKRFFLDAIQSLGQHEVDVKAANIDYLAAGGSKWLMAGAGKGIFYCSKDGLKDIRKEGFGASSQKDAHTADSELREDATIFEEGMKNYASIAGLGASMTLINRIGIQNIEKRIAELTDLLCQKLSEIGYEVVSPRDARSKSGLVLFRHPTKDSAEINEGLRKGEKPIWMSIRNGNMRACVHYYNTEEEILKLVERLSAAE